MKYGLAAPVSRVADCHVPPGMKLPPRIRWTFSLSTFPSQNTLLTGSQAPEIGLL
ncbi:hypothetical protein D3C86_2119350 [compost metagenome]